jgi:hypothetical protein
MASAEDPALMIWRAINILAEVNARLDDSTSTDKILEAEMVLLNLMLSLWQSTRQPDPAEQIGYVSRAPH